MEDQGAEAASWGVCQERIVTSVLEAVSRASGSPFSASISHSRPQYVARVQAVMAADPALALEAVAAAMHALFAVLSRSPGAAASLPELELLQAPKLRAQTVGRLASALADAYETVYAALTAPANGYAGAEAAVGHTPAQLRTVCQGL